MPIKLKVPEPALVKTPRVLVCLQVQEEGHLTLQCTRGFQVHFFPLEKVDPDPGSKRVGPSILLAQRFSIDAWADHNITAGVST